MNLKDLSKPLSSTDIDFRVQSINMGGYATILAYKDARVDQQRLDDVVGPMNWQRTHARENKNCIVSIWCENKKQWVSKEDTGTESYTEAAKGLASDSFKRACFNWGIGRELYDYPIIKVKLNPGTSPKDAEFKIEGNKAKQTWNLQLKDWVWRVDHVGNELTYIAAKDQNGEMRFFWGSAAKKAVTENFDSVTGVINALQAEQIEQAAECWFEISPNARKSMYVSEKHGGPFSPQERKIMQDEFINYYQGSNWSGLFTEVE